MYFCPIFRHGAKSMGRELIVDELPVHRLVNNADVVAFKMGRRQGARRAHI